MPRESNANKTQRAEMVCQRLSHLYPNPKCALDHTDAFTLIIAVLLSAQTTDAQVNKVTPELFAKWPDPQSMAQASVSDVASTIRTLGFYKVKAKHVVEAAQMIMSDFGGVVPHTMDELTRIPGVGRKTANIVLSVSYGIVDGIAVDTHVYRIALRLKLTNAPTPLKAEQDLLRVIPKKYWGTVNERWVLFGREYCDAKAPRCEDCCLSDICPSAFQPVKTKAQMQKQTRKRTTKTSKS